MTLFLYVSALAGVLCLLFFVIGISALRHKRPVRMANHLLFALLSFTIAALFGMLAITTQGYRALTHEELVAAVSTRPLGKQRFEAQFRFPDGREKTVELAGDELYVDAHILKWKPVGNILTLDTVYELGRVAGRYRELDDEQNLPRTVFALGEQKPADLFDLRRRYTFLAPLVDAEYGSATFMPARTERNYEIRVSTTGLLMRVQETPEND